MSNWHIMFPDGRRIGPVDAEQVRQEIAAGRVPPGTAACPVGGTQWTPVTIIADFHGGPPSSVRAGFEPSHPANTPRPHALGRWRTPTSAAHIATVAAVVGALSAIPMPALCDHAFDQADTACVIRNFVGEASEAAKQAVEGATTLAWICCAASVVGLIDLATRWSRDPRRAVEPVLVLRTSLVTAIAGGIAAFVSGLTAYRTFELLPVLRATREFVERDCFLEIRSLPFEVGILCVLTTAVTLLVAVFAIRTYLDVRRRSLEFQGFTGLALLLQRASSTAGRKWQKEHYLRELEAHGGAAGAVASARSAVDALAAEQADLAGSGIEGRLRVAIDAVREKRAYVTVLTGNSAPATEVERALAMVDAALIEGAILAEPYLPIGAQSALAGLGTESNTVVAPISQPTLVAETAPTGRISVSPLAPPTRPEPQGQSLTSKVLLDPPREPANTTHVAFADAVGGSQTGRIEVGPPAAPTGLEFGHADAASASAVGAVAGSTRKPRRWKVVVLVCVVMTLGVAGAAAAVYFAGGWGSSTARPTPRRPTAPSKAAAPPPARRR